jgi:hypothetical protein
MFSLCIGFILFNHRWVFYVWQERWALVAMSLKSNPWNNSFGML